jgi:DNA-binding transcriptional MerR regulator
MQQEVIQEALRRLEESEGAGVFFAGRVITDPAELEAEMLSASPAPLSPQPPSPQLETSVAVSKEIEEQLAAAQARIAELEGSALPADASVLPADAREKLIAIKGVSEKLADEILAAFAPTAPTD